MMEAISWKDSLGNDEGTWYCRNEHQILSEVGEPVGGEWWRKVGQTFSLAWPPESVAQRRATRRYEVKWDSPTLCRALWDSFEFAGYVVPEDQVVNCHQCGKRDITEAVASEMKKGEQWFCAECAVMDESLWLPQSTIDERAKKRNISYSKAMEEAEQMHTQALNRVVTETAKERECR